ncbi:hypothetical protein MJ579_11510 [Klebsiella pneumoniae]|nr:hypothetical protein MJ579_11510 [Klebsiella pneumoniae]
MASSARQRLAGHPQMLSMAMWTALLVAPIQERWWGICMVLIPLSISRRIAAIEGTGKIAPASVRHCCCFGLPDAGAGADRYGLEIPALGSLIIPQPA